MERSHVAEHDAERARLRALVARLTEADMARPVSEDWTVGVRSVRGSPPRMWTS
jgi:hypothetical protein